MARYIFPPSTLCVVEIYIRLTGRYLHWANMAILGQIQHIILLMFGELRPYGFSHLFYT